MSAKFSSLKLRTISALGALAGLIGTFWLLDLVGLVLIVLFSHIVISIEGYQLFVGKTYGKISKILFFLFNFLIFLLVSFFPEIAFLGFVSLATIFLAFTILLSHEITELSDLLKSAAGSMTGFFYLAILPACVVQIILTSSGIEWFGLLLVVVFSGDICAYLAGLTLGKHKLMPKISPKKTIEGSLGGLFGSLLGASIYSVYFLPEANVFFVMFMSLVTGAVAQIGDLFESLAKRVANVKDSGRIMPGHGGLLDRLDGVLFAAPLVLLWMIVANNL